MGSSIGQAVTKVQHFLEFSENIQSLVFYAHFYGYAHVHDHTLLRHLVILYNTSSLYLPHQTRRRAGSWWTWCGWRWRRTRSSRECAAWAETVSRGQEGVSSKVQYSRAIIILFVQLSQSNGNSRKSHFLLQKVHKSSVWNECSVVWSLVYLNFAVVNNLQF